MHVFYLLNVLYQYTSKYIHCVANKTKIEKLLWTKLYWPYSTNEKQLNCIQLEWNEFLLFLRTLSTLDYILFCFAKEFINFRYVTRKFMHFLYLFRTPKTTVYPIWFVASFKNDFYWQVTNFSQAQQFSSLLCILRHFAMHWREMVLVGDNWLKASIISTAFIVITCI